MSYSPNVDSKGNFHSTDQAGATNTIFVRSGGSDTTGNGKTSGTAYRTFQRAILDVPTTMNDVAWLIDVTGIGTENFANDFGFGPMVQDKFTSSTGTSPTMPGLLALTILAEPTNQGTLTFVSSVNNIDQAQLQRVTVSETLTPGALVGKFLYAAGGVRVCVIVANTANTIDITSSAAPTGAMFYGVPSAEFAMAAGKLFRVNATALQVNGIKFSAATAGANSLQLTEGSGNIVLTGCDLQAPNGSSSALKWSVTGCYIHGVGSSTLMNMSANSTGFSQCYFSAIRFAHTANNTLGTIRQSVFTGCQALGRSDQTSHVTDRQSWSHFQNLIVNSADGYGLWIEGVENFNGDHIAFGNNSTAAIIADDRSRGYLVNCGNSVMLTSTTNGAGLQVTNGAQIEIDTGMSVTGNAGDFKVGARPYRTWADLTAGGQQAGSQYNEIDVTGDSSRVYYANIAPGSLGLATVSADRMLSTDQANATRFIYARSTGSDTTGDGKTTGTAYRTFVRAMKDVPVELNHLYVVVDITGIGIETVTAPYFFPPIDGGNQIQATGTGNVQFPRLGPLTILAAPTNELTVTISSSTNTTDAAQLRRVVVAETLTPGAWVGHWLYAATGQVCAVITANDVHNIDIAATTAPSGAAFIGKPSAEITSSTANFNTMLIIANAQVQISGVKISHATSTIQALSIANVPNIQLTGCDLQLPTTRSPTIALFEQCYAHGNGNSGSTLNLVGQCSLSQSFFQSLRWQFANQTGKINISQSVFDGCADLGRASASAPGAGTNVAWNIANTVIVNPSSVYGLMVQGAMDYYLSRVVFGNCPTAALFADTAARLCLNFVQQVGTKVDGSTTYTANGAGMIAINGSRVECDTNCSVTGTAGDFKVGLLPYRTWSNFNSLTPINNEVDIAGDGSRVYVVGSTAHHYSGGIAFEDFERWVATTGSDSNPGTQAQPFLTFDKAWNSLPAAWYKKCRLHFATGTYAIAAAQTQYLVGTPIGSLAEPLVIDGTFIDSGLGTRTSTAADVFSITDSALTPTLDQYAGFSLLVTSGPGANTRATIATNDTAGKFEIISTFLTGQPVAGNTFAVQQPGVIFTNATSVAFAGGGGLTQLSLAMRGISFQPTTQSLTFSGLAMILSGCELIATTARLNIIGGTQVVAKIVNPPANYISGSYFSTSEVGSGLFVKNSPITVQDGGSSFIGYLCHRAAASFSLCVQNAVFAPNGLDANGCEYIVGSGGFFTMLGSANRVSRIASAPNRGNTAYGAIMFRGGGNSGFIRNLDISNAGAAGIYVESSQIGYLTNTSVGIAGLTGTGNVWGWMLVRAGQVYGMQSTTLTGSSGDISLESLGAKTYAQTVDPGILDTRQNYFRSS